MLGERAAVGVAPPGQPDRTQRASFVDVDRDPVHEVANPDVGRGVTGVDGVRAIKRLTLVIDGALEGTDEADDATIIRELKRRLGDGSSARDAAAQVAAGLRVPRRRVYELSLRLRSATSPRRKARPSAGR